MTIRDILITGKTAKLPGDWKQPREPAGERPSAAAPGPLSPQEPSDRPRAASTYTIRIPGWMPTPLNRLMAQHWAKAARLKKADAAILFTYADQYAIPRATGKRSVELLVVLPPRQRAPDPDALWKSLLDAAVHAGLLVNDSHHWVEAAPVQFARGDKLTTYLTLTDHETPR